MIKSLLSTHLNYHYWAHARVWECVELLPEAEYRRMDTGGSVHHQLVTMMATENLWINYLWHGEVEYLTPDHFRTRQCIRAEWTALEEELRDFVDVLDRSAAFTST